MSVCGPGNSEGLLLKSCWKVLVFSIAILIQDTSEEAVSDSLTDWAVDFTSSDCGGGTSFEGKGTDAVCLVGEDAAFLLIEGEGTGAASTVGEGMNSFLAGGATGRVGPSGNSGSLLVRSC